ncbi:hypothetical protein IFR04_001112 [Cadophora malorum]|uniref:Uncharacterized protein n=1 Tax=Cadophora malorum TaxID=108018 RepID=A0A8H7WIU9_9HELO|nr:hypothetical protein IFR04_001112 [Cadophora malorum]
MSGTLNQGSSSAPPISCVYAESNKRGIPGGYVAALEVRLIETEVALYNVLCELRDINQTGRFSSGGPLPYSVPDALLRRQHGQGNESKVLKMGEWKRLPLSTPEDVQNWWTSLRAEHGIVDQIPEHGDIPDMYDRETSHAETPGQMSYRSESGVPEDININLINSGNLHSQIPMQHIHDPQLADPTVNRTGMMSYVVDDTGQHVIDSGSWDNGEEEKKKKKKKKKKKIVLKNWPL